MSGGLSGHSDRQWCAPRWAVGSRVTQALEPPFLPQPASFYLFLIFKKKKIYVTIATLKMVLKLQLN